MKEHKRLLTLLGVLVIVTIIFFMYNSSPEQISSPHSYTQKTSTPVKHTTIGTTETSATTQPQSGYMMTYTANGFSPKTIQIPRGKSVKFVNDSDTPLLVVADNGGNSFNSQINQPKAVARGGVYTFDFTYVGVWAFHNANKTGDHGNIVVY